MNPRLRKNWEREPPCTEDDLVAAFGRARKAHDQRHRLAKKYLDVYRLKRLLYDRWRARRDFTYFVKQVRPDVIVGRHHRIMARAFERLARGELLRLMIFMPPGHTKSLFTSILLPAWLLGLDPKGRILATSHTKDLVEGFGRDIKDLIGSDEYRRLFPGVALRADVKAAARWDTDKGGKYVGVGVGGAVAGKRADLLGIIDDPISEQDAYSDTVREKVKKWYPGGFRTRLLPGTPIVLVMTRWHHADLAGHLLTESKINEKKEQWEVISFPAVLDRESAAFLNRADNDNEAPARAGDALFPELWPIEEMRVLREEMPPNVWQALYLQRPLAEEGGIFKTHWWQPWPREMGLPEWDYILQVWDTAYEEDEENDYSACTTWGVFWDEMKRRYALFLLDRYNERRDFPDLREDALGLYQRYQPDAVLIEPKATGKSVVQELRRRGVPVREYRVERTTRGRELSKVARAHAAAVTLWGGAVYYPEGMRWAREVIDQCAEFPKGEHDDMVDTCTMAWIYLRRTWWAHVKTDEDDEDDETEAAKPREAAYG